MSCNQAQRRTKLFRLLVKSIAEPLVAVTVGGARRNLRRRLLGRVQVELLILGLQGLEGLELRLHQALDGGGRHGGGEGGGGSGGGGGGGQGGGGGGGAEGVAGGGAGPVEPLVQHRLTEPAGGLMVSHRIVGKNQFQNTELF